MLRVEKTAERFYVIASASSGKGEISSKRPTRPDLTYDTEYEAAEDRELGAAPTCPLCGRFVGMREWLPPLRVELTLHGTEWGDFAFAPGGFRFLLSARVVAAFAEAGLKGLGLEPVEVVVARRSRLSPPQYFRAEPARSETEVDERRSSFARSHDSAYCERCGAGVEGIEGFALKTDTWLGEDAFEARNLAAVPIASERLRALADTTGFTNVRFIPTESYRWDPYEPVR